VVGAAELTALVVLLVPLAWAMLLGRLVAGVGGSKAVR